MMDDKPSPKTVVYRFAELSRILRGTISRYHFFSIELSFSPRFQIKFKMKARKESGEGASFNSLPLFSNFALISSSQVELRLSLSRYCCIGSWCNQYFRFGKGPQGARLSHLDERALSPISNDNTYSSVS